MGKNLEGEHIYLTLCWLCGLYLSGVCDPGEFPGYLIAHSGKGRFGQAALLHPPDLAGESGLLRGSLCSSGVDSICHGVY